MENKYYIPDISEFHVGFEYERCDNWYSYFKDIYPRAVNQNKLENYLPYFRVKYLDREDIESLGFEYDQSTKDGSYFYSGTLITENQWCIILKDFTIDIYDINGKSDFRFNGLVKNKSELKQILKMIGYEL